MKCVFLTYPDQEFEPEHARALYSSYKLFVEQCDVTEAIVYANNAGAVTLISMLLSLRNKVDSLKKVSVLADYPSKIGSLPAHNVWYPKMDERHFVVNDNLDFVKKDREQETLLAMSRLAEGYHYLREDSRFDDCHIARSVYYHERGTGKLLAYNILTYSDEQWEMMYT